MIGTRGRLLATAAVLALLALCPRQALASGNGHAVDAELERFIADVHGVVRHEHRIGAEIDFWLWTDAGAISVVSMTWHKRDGDRGKACSQAYLERALKPGLAGFVGTHKRYLRVRLRRDKTCWRATSVVQPNPASYTDLPADGPPEGRSIPLSDPASRSLAIQVVTEKLAREVIKLAQVPVGGAGEYRIRVKLDDERIASWLPAGYQLLRSGIRVKRGPKSLTVGSWSAQIFAKALVPFARGLGPRQVELVLRAEHKPRTATASWQLVRAGVIRAGRQTDEFATIVSEYRHTHEQILADWHSNVREAAVHIAGFTVEQVAVWVIGGWLFKAAGAVLHPLAPRLIAILRGASKSRATGAAEYLETMLWRLPRSERHAVKAIMGKAETQGMKALSGAERTQQETLLQRLEGLVGKRLTGEEKKQLRRAMKRRFDQVQPGVKDAFAKAGLIKTDKQIHHRVPLEWAHRIPALDINGPGNLVMVHHTVHKSLNAVWKRFGTASPGKVTEHHIKRVVDIGDRHFRHWYNKPPAQPGWEKVAQTAKARALAEVDALIASIARAGH